MKSRIFDLLLSILPIFAYTQNSEVGLILGASVYQGDLTPSQVLISFGEVHSSYGGFYKYTLNDFCTVKLGITQGILSGNDGKSKEEGRKDRNLSFRSSLTEMSITGEINGLGFHPKNLLRPFSPYIFGGIALFHFNPKAKLDGIDYELQPRGTEGQYLDNNKTPYKLLQLAIPVGAGFKYAINDTWIIGFEMGTRLTFTDYIDDVSTTYIGDHKWIENGDEITGALANRSPNIYNGGESRGDAENKDWYIIGAISVSYNLMQNGLFDFRNKNKGSQTDCPVF